VSDRGFILIVHDQLFLINEFEAVYLTGRLALQYVLKPAKLRAEPLRLLIGGEGVRL
jgi:hypothetical protein